MRTARRRTDASGRSLRRRVLRVGAAPVGGMLLRPLLVLALLLAAGAIALLLLATMLLGSIRFEAAQAACRPGSLPGDGPAVAVGAGRSSGRRSTGGALPTSRIVQYAADAGFSGDDLTIAVAVALAESGGVPDNENHANANGSSDYGLWQINTVHRSAGFDASRAADPTYNAMWARRVFLAAGGSWRPWVAYTNGSYQRHLATARRAVGSAPVARARLAGTAAVGGGATPARELAAVCPTVPGGSTVRLAQVTSRNGPLTAADLAGLGSAIGHAVPPYSVLRDATAYGDGTGGPSVNMLAPQMQASVARLELAMGARLMVVSGYRTAAYQAELCRRVAGPCAPPGRSMHQHGLAVDVRNWRQALPHLSAVGLCQPLPTNDAGHLSHVDGREC